MCWVHAERQEGCFHWGSSLFYTIYDCRPLAGEGCFVNGKDARSLIFTSTGLLSANILFSPDNVEWEGTLVWTVDDGFCDSFSSLVSCPVHINHVDCIFYVVGYGKWYCGFNECFRSLQLHTFFYLIFALFRENLWSSVLSYRGWECRDGVFVRIERWSRHQRRTWKARGLCSHGWPPAWLCSGAPCPTSPSTRRSRGPIMQRVSPQESVWCCFLLTYCAFSSGEWKRCSAAAAVGVDWVLRSLCGQ